MSTRSMSFMCRSGFPDVLEVQAIVGMPNEGIMLQTHNQLMGHPHQIRLGPDDVEVICDFLGKYLDDLKRARKEPPRGSHEAAR